MDSAPAPSPAPPSTGLIRAIAITALVAGTLDYAAAISNFMIGGGKDPNRVAWYIASSVLGSKAAFTGGWLTAAFGIFLHYVIATGWTVLFFLGYRRVPMLRKNPFLVGAAYGLFVWAMMNRVLVPLTRIKTGEFTLNSAAMIQAAILMAFIGLPIALLAHRHFRKA